MIIHFNDKFAGGSRSCWTEVGIASGQNSNVRKVRQDQVGVDLNLGIP